MATNIIKVRHWVSLRRGPSPVYDYLELRAGADIVRELEDLSNSLRLNAEAMALLQSVPNNKHRDENAIAASHIYAGSERIERSSGKPRFYPPRVNDLKQMFSLMSSRVDDLKKTVMDMEAQVSLIKRLKAYSPATDTEPRKQGTRTMFFSSNS